MIRTLDVRFDVYRGGARRGQIIPVGIPSAMMRKRSAIKTSLKASFLPSADVDWLSDEIHPVLIIDGVEHPAGAYIPVSVAEKETETSHEVQVEAYERSWILASFRTETVLHFSAGTPYLAAVESLLVAAGLSLWAETPSAAVLATDREDWPVGTDYLTIINELLAEINYNSLWFNSVGLAMLEPVRRPTAANISHTLDAADVSSMLLPQYSAERDMYDAPNVFICVCSNPDLSGPITSVCVNDNLQSPLSVQRRGRRIAEYCKISNIADQTALDAYAKNLVMESMMSSELITVSTALRPGHGVGDVIALHYGETDGICVEEEWSMELVSGGTMSHTLRRVVFMLDG